MEESVISRQTFQAWKRKGDQKRKFIIILFSLIVVFAASLVYTIIAFYTPVKRSEKLILSNFRQTADGSFIAIAKPSLLFPQGGEMGARKTYLTNLVNNFIFKFDVQFKSNKPISYTGKSKVILKLKADKLWERDFPLVPEKEFNFKETSSGTILKGDYAININALLAFCKQVEREIQTIPSSYTLIIMPIIQGESQYGSYSKKVAFMPEYTLSLAPYQIIPGPLPDQEMKLVFDTNQEQDGYLKFLGAKITVMIARYIFTALTIILLGTIVIVGRTIWLTKQEYIPEGILINRKYRNRITYGMENSMVDTGGVLIKTKSFGELIRIADDQDIPIICLNNNSNLGSTFLYYVIHGSVTYTYMST